MQTLDRAPLPSDVVPAATRTILRTRGVGLIGCGTVGAGVARRLIASHPGLLRAIAVRDPRKPRDVAWSEYLDDPFAVVDDPTIGIVVECIGGLGLARELVLRAIARGKDVVTANKDLIATEGPWLAAFAARTGASLRYEAAVGGAIPIVRALGGALAAEDVLEVGGVLNGTTNFILDAMADGAEYADALAEAQRRGFAEADPRNDVEGHDAAHKLAILAGLAFRKPSTSALVVRRGIAGISRDDVRAGAERGLRLKLVALARKDGEVIEAGVTPAFVPEDHPFARPRGAENVVRVLGRGCGPLTFSGQGAGGDATASAVVADVFGALAVRADAAPVHDGDEVVPRPLQAPLLVRFGNGNVVTSEPLALDALEAARAAYAGSGEVRSLIPLLSNSL